MKEIINIIPYFIAIFVGNIFYNWCFDKLNNTKLKLNGKNIVTMLITAVLVFICNMYIKLEIKSFIVFIIMCINFKVIYKLNIKRTIISYLLIFILLMILEIIISIILSMFGILNSNEAALALNYIKIFLSVFIILIEYMILSIPKVKMLLKKVLNVLQKNTNIFNISFLMYVTLIVLSILNINKFATDNSTQLIVLLIIIFALLFAIVIKSKTNEEFLKKSNKRLTDYNEKYAQFLDEYKIYKHNIKHKLAGMKTYGNKKINFLIDDLLEEETSFTIKNNNLYNIPNGIKGIVAERLYNIKINVIIDNKLKEDPFLKLSPRIFNSVSESIGICLDNAVEASIETDNPIVTMDLYEDDENIYIKIGNNFCNNIDIDELGDKYYSTKNRGSGLGLFSIIQNKLIKEKISIINDFYYIELKIKKHE